MSCLCNDLCLAVAGLNSMKAAQDWKNHKEMLGVKVGWRSNEVCHQCGAMKVGVRLKLDSALDGYMFCCQTSPQHTNNTYQQTDPHIPHTKLRLYYYFGPLAAWVGTTRSQRDFICNVCIAGELCPLWIIYGFVLKMIRWRQLHNVNLGICHWMNAGLLCLG
jgi:hypothetical protein